MPWRRRRMGRPSGTPPCYCSSPNGCSPPVAGARSARTRATTRATSSRCFGTWASLSCHPEHDAARGSAIDGGTTRHVGYRQSQAARPRIEPVFGWLKTIAGLRKGEAPRLGQRGPARGLRERGLQSAAAPEVAAGNTMNRESDPARPALGRPAPTRTHDQRDQTDRHAFMRRRFQQALWRRYSWHSAADRNMRPAETVSMASHEPLQGPARQMLEHC